MNLILSASEVAEIIEPADPDNLQHLGSGVYEAKWSPENPATDLDVTLLPYVPRISVLGNAYEPEHLPGWIAVKFTVSEPEDER